jgi:anti-sigma regulatory factor (Ser/Thr protein kinase)
MSKMKLPAKIENLDKLIQFVSKCARERGLPDKKVGNIELATEETLVNIFNYAYPDDDTGDVELICKTDNNNRFIIEIIDTGIPFNPLSKTKPDLTGDISERKVGGLGIFFIRKIVDEVRYRREDNKNILTFILHRK